MSPTLDGIPNELFERIVEQLDKRDIFALRIGSRLLASKCTQKTFKSFLRTKHVHLNEWSLTRFVHATRSSWLVEVLENLVLVGMAADMQYMEEVLEGDDHPWVKPSPESVDSLKTRREELHAFHESKENQWLLSEALRNLNQSIALRCLSLQVRVHYLDGIRHATPAVQEYLTRRSGINYNARFGPTCEAAAHLPHRYEIVDVEPLDDKETRPLHQYRNAAM